MLRDEMTDTVRTPDGALEGLPDFPWTSHYRESKDCGSRTSTRATARRSSSSTASRPGPTSGAT